MTQPGDTPPPDNNDDSAHLSSDEAPQTTDNTPAEVRTLGRPPRLRIAIALSLMAAACYIMTASMGLLLTIALPGLLVAVAYAVLLPFFKGRSVSRRSPEHIRHLDRPLLVGAFALLFGGLMSAGMGMTVWIFIGAVVMGIGVLICCMGILRRTGEHLVCGKCRYPQESPPAQRCPECGTDARSDGIPYLLGEAAPKPTLITAGALLILLSFLPGIRFTAAPAPLLQYLPTGMLIGQVRHASPLTGDRLWNELTTRELSDAQKDALVQAFVEQWDSPFAHRIGLDWVADALSRDALSDSAKESLADALFDFRLILPEQVTPGEPIHIQVRRARWMLTSNFSDLLGIAELTANGQPIRPRSRSRSLLSADRPMLIAVLAPPDPEHPEERPITIRLVADAVIVPMQQRPRQLEYDRDGDPILPDNTLLHRRVTLTATVQHPSR